MFRLFQKNELAKRPVTAALLRTAEVILMDLN